MTITPHLTTPSTVARDTNESIILKQCEGKCLDVSLLVNVKKKFRKTKDTVTDTMKKLEEEGLGNLVPKKSNRNFI